VHHAPSRGRSKRLERIVLQRTASRNIRRHWLRGFFRVASLVTTDLAVLTILRGILEAVTESGVVASSVAEFARAVLPQEFLAGWPFTFAAVLSLLVVGSYGPGEKRRDIGRLMAASGLAAALTVYHLVWLESLLAVSLSFGAVTMLCWMVLTVSRMTLDALLKWLVPSVRAQRVVTVCNGKTDWLDPSMQNMGGGAGGSSLRVVGTVSTSRFASDDNGAPLRQLGAVIDRCKADAVLVCGPLSDHQFEFVVDTALVSGCRLLAASRAPRIGGVEPRGVWIDGLPLVELTAPALKAWQLAAKRVMDLAAAVSGLVLLAPLFVVIALAVRFGSPGPVFFRQWRVGRAGRPFEIFKFRSMVLDAEQRLEPLRKDSIYADSRLFKVVNDPRITRVGAFLRRSSLDELPQLLNVFRGEMSLVGPRPPTLSEVTLYKERERCRFDVKPGITGPWQVNGRNRITDFEDVVRLERAYIRDWSFTSDLKILLRTLPVVLRTDGAH